MSDDAWQQRLAAAIRTRDDIAAEAKAAATSVYGPDTEAWSSEEWTQVIVVALDMLGKEHRATPPPDTAVRLPPKERAREWLEANGMAFNDARLVASLTELIRERDRSHTDELREAAEHLRAVYGLRHPADCVCVDHEAAAEWLDRYDERTRNGQP